MSSRSNYIFLLKIIRCKDAVIKMQILARSEVNVFHQIKTLEFCLSQVLVFKGWIFMGNLKAKIVRSPWKKVKLKLIGKHKMFVSELEGVHEPWIKMQSILLEKVCTFRQISNRIQKLSIIISLEQYFSFFLFLF